MQKYKSTENFLNTSNKDEYNKTIRIGIKNYLFYLNNYKTFTIRKFSIYIFQQVCLLMPELNHQTQLKYFINFNNRTKISKNHYNFQKITNIIAIKTKR